MATALELKKQFSHYWNPRYADSFHQITARLKDTAKKIDRERNEVIKNFSALFALMPNHPNLVPSVNNAKGLIKDAILEVKGLQKEISPAYQLGFRAEPVNENDDIFIGDRASFKRRLETLTEEIHKVYKDSIYPFLLAVQNAEKGWDPAGYVCIASDYFYWRSRDAEGELAKVFNREMLSSTTDLDITEDNEI